MFSSWSKAAAQWSLAPRVRSPNAAARLAAAFLIAIRILSLPASADYPQTSIQDLGEIPSSAATTREFAWTNATGRALRLTSVVPSCDCVQVTSFTEKVPPDAVGRITLTVTPRSPGRGDWLVQVLTEGDPTPWSLALSARVTGEVSTNRDAVHLTTVSELKSKLGHVKLVDVRSAAVFQKLHITDSVNLPLFAVKTKTYWRDQSVVLLNEGHSLEAMREEAVRLSAMGFKDVKVLEGGLRAWQMTGGLVTGSDTNSLSHATISAVQFDVARGEPGWLIAAPENQVLHSDVICEVKNVTAELLSTAVQRNPAAQRILMLTPEGHDYERVERALAAFRELPVFYLAGGLQSYQSMLQDQFAVRNSRTITISSQNQNPSRFNTGGRSSSKGGSCCGGK